MAAFDRHVIEGKVERRKGEGAMAAILFSFDFLTLPPFFGASVLIGVERVGSEERLRFLPSWSPRHDGSVQSGRKRLASRSLSLAPCVSSGVSLSVCVCVSVRAGEREREKEKEK